MKVWNTCNEKEKHQKNGIFETSKKDQKNHGIGLKNIRQTIEKNHGSIQTREERGGFLIVLQLPLNANG
jgi:sensor histidine kinase regulating citrate/malate metabolism